jgi:alpha-galactosidase
MTPLGQRGLVAMAGVFGYELDLTKLSEKEIGEITQQTALYRKIRHTVQFGTLYRLETPWQVRAPAEAAVYCAWEYAAENGTQIVLSVVLTGAEANSPPCLLKLRGLRESAVYETVCSSASFPQEKQKFGGAELMYAGLRFQFIPAYGGSLQIVFSLCS